MAHYEPSHLNLCGLQVQIFSFLTWPRGYKTFFMLNSIEHENLNAHKYKNINKNQLFLGSDKPRMLFFLHINVKICWHFNFYEREKFHALLS